MYEQSMIKHLSFRLSKRFVVEKYCNDLITGLTKIRYIKMGSKTVERYGSFKLVIFLKEKPLTFLSDFS